MSRSQLHQAFFLHFYRYFHTAFFPRPFFLLLSVVHLMCFVVLCSPSFGDADRFAAISFAARAPLNRAVIVNSRWHRPGIHIRWTMHRGKLEPTQQDLGVAGVKKLMRYIAKLQFRIFWRSRVYCLAKTAVQCDSHFLYAVCLSMFPSIFHVKVVKEKL